MQVLVLLSLPVFVASLAASLDLYKEVYRLEERTIGVDNAGISLASADAHLFNHFEKSKRTFDRLETAHHIVHLCARSAVATAACLKQDVALEKALTVSANLLWKSLQIKWTKNLIAAQSEAIKRRTTVCIKHRPRLPPFERGVCETCSLPVKWKQTVRRPLWEVSECPQRNAPLVIQTLLEKSPSGKWWSRLREG